MHFVKIWNKQLDEFRKRFELSREVLSGLGIEEDDYEVGIRFTEDFYNENKESNQRDGFKSRETSFS